MEQQDVERIARGVLKDLGVVGAELRVSQDPAQPGFLQIEIHGVRGPGRLRIKCSEGTTPQWVRQQIFEQYLAQS